MAGEPRLIVLLEDGKWFCLFQFLFITLQAEMIKFVDNDSV